MANRRDRHAGIFPSAAARDRHCVPGSRPAANSRSPVASGRMAAEGVVIPGGGAFSGPTPSSRDPRLTRGEGCRAPPAPSVKGQ
jgi:hypothetical protein